MITNLIRKALAPSIEMILNVERIRLNDIITEMENAVDDVKSIRASDIADNISTYDIAQDISLDTYDLARSIEIDASDIEVDTRDLADRIAREITIDAEEITIDYSALGRQIVGNIDIDYSDLAREISDYVDLSEVNARINNVHHEVSALGLKIQEIYEFIRKTTGQDMLDSEAQINGGAQ